MTDVGKQEESAVHHFTREGDDGSTSLGELGAVRKDDPRLDTYADCGEANAAIGLALAMSALPVHVVTTLSSLQHDLFDLVTGITHPSTQGTEVEVHEWSESHITQAHIDRIEALCDHYGADLPPSEGYVLPGGTVTAALLFRAWSATQKAERMAWHAHREFPEGVSELVGRYLNRLASLLYVLARAANAEHGDIVWYPMASVTAQPEAAVIAEDG